MPMKLAASVVATVLFLSVMPALAHHAFSAEFDVDKPIRLEGKVARVEWVNPHAWIHIDVKKPDGSVERWMIEGGTPNTLFRRGVTKDSLLPGTSIIVTGYQAKDGSLHASYSYFLNHLPKDSPHKSIKHAHFNVAWVKQGD